MKNSTQNPSSSPMTDVQQYRLEQLEKQWEKQQETQKTFEGQIGTRIDATITNQTYLYDNYLNTLSVIFVLLGLVGGFFVFIGWKRIKKTITKTVEKDVKIKIDAMIKEKSAVVDNEIIAFKTKVDNEVNAFKAKVDKRLSQQDAEINSFKEFEQGNREFDNKNYEKASEYFSNAIRLKPDYADAYYNSGITKAKLGQYPEAIVDFNEVIRLKPDDVEAYSNRGTLKVKLEQYAEAISDFDKAISLKPDDADACFNKACALALMNKPDEALESLEKAIGFDKEIIEQAKTDDDFKSLHDNPRFKKLVGLE